LLTDIMAVFRHPNTFLLFLIPGGIVGSVLTFSGLWGVPFLAAHHGLSTARASALASAVLVAWAVGGPIFGWFSDRIGRRKLLYLFGCAVSLAGWIVAFWVPSISITVLSLALLTAGFGSGCMVLTFAFAKESVPVRLSGTVTGAMNMGVMMGAMLLQPAVGWVLDSKWRGEMIDGVRYYGLDAYKTGFLLMLGWLALSLLLLFFTRETHCRQVG